MSMWRKITLASLLFLSLALFVIPISMQASALGGVQRDSVNVYSALGTSFYDPYYGSYVTEVAKGAILNVSVTFTPTGSCQAAGCNMSIGFAFDTLPNYTITASGYSNATNANPHNTFTALPYQTYVVSFAVTAPPTATSAMTHQYQVDIVNYAKANNASSDETLLDSLTGSVAIISPQQAKYWSASQNLTMLSNAYGSAFSSILASPNSYEYSQTVSYLSQSSASTTKAGQQYSEGNFAGANASEVMALTQYQQAIQSYQASANSLSSANNNYNSLIPYGVILLGIGALIAGMGLGIGAFRKAA
jgi:hypothetical protein